MEDLSPGNYSDNQLRRKNWCDSNSSSVIDPGFDMTQAHHNRFASGNQLGDTSISIIVKKPEAFGLSNTDTINIVSDDRGLVNWPDHYKYGGPGNLTASGASIGFIFENSDLAYQIY